MDVNRIGITNSIALRNYYRVECRDKDGNLKWVETIKNITVNVGLNDILSQYFKGSSYTAAFFVGLKGTGTASATDTMASHSGWVEIAAYTQSTRPSLVLGAVASQSVDNSASKAVFSINGTATVAGAFVTTNSTISGTTGTLYGAADFSVARGVATGDTINVQVTLTAATA